VLLIDPVSHSQGQGTKGRGSVVAQCCDLLPPVQPKDGHVSIKVSESPLWMALWMEGSENGAGEETPPRYFMQEGQAAILSTAGGSSSGNFGLAAVHVRVMEKRQGVVSSEDGLVPARGAKLVARFHTMSCLPSSDAAESGASSAAVEVGGPRYALKNPGTSDSVDLELHLATGSSGVGKAVIRLPHAITDMAKNIASVVVSDPLNGGKLVACADLFSPQSLISVGRDAGKGISSVGLSIISACACMACLSFYSIAWLRSVRLKAAAQAIERSLTQQNEADQLLVDRCIEEAMMSGSG
jgi:hypothetical protein